MEKLRQTYFYKVAALERAITKLASLVRRPQECGERLYLTPMETASLLEAARIGLGRIYDDHSILERLNYPLP